MVKFCEALFCNACAFACAIGKALWIIALNNESLPTDEDCKPLWTIIASTASTAGLAHAGTLLSSKPSKSLSIWPETRASSGNSETAATIAGWVTSKAPGLLTTVEAACWDKLEFCAKLEAAALAVEAFKESIICFLVEPKPNVSTICCAFSLVAAVSVMASLVDISSSLVAETLVVCLKSTCCTLASSEISYSVRPALASRSWSRSLSVACALSLSVASSSGEASLVKVVTSSAALAVEVSSTPIVALSIPSACSPPQIPLAIPTGLA